jgi:hypothetical protein
MKVRSFRMHGRGHVFLRGRDTPPVSCTSVSYGLGEHLSAKLMAIAPVASELAA